ncbi:MAG: LysM peptidoglycan-binding domain-containing protein [Lachnospiraceae bacterium]
MDNNYFGNICYCKKCNGIIHTIKKGDTLYLLSRYYNVPIGEIMNANRNMNVYNLRIGEEICIPVRRSDMMNDTVGMPTDTMETDAPQEDFAEIQSESVEESFDKSILMADLIKQKDMTFEKFLTLIQN